ncbi:MAG: C4-type zinc ribbon domain-containing protein [Candidatus Sumerlaeota bacterium]|nr:C4-type zinc ribbon domain-containing protein [Candidatus Sumerlaeota bacterium]
MDENGKRLLELQKIDSQIVEFERQLEAYPKRIQALEGDAVRAREELEAATQRLKDARARRGLMESEIKTTQEAVRKSLTQQMQVKTNKEYQAITHQIETLKQQISDQETSVLEAMEREDEMQSRLAELKDAAGHAQREFESEKVRILALEAEKRERLEALRAERKACLQLIPEDLADQYRRLFLRFPGAAIAPTDGITCGGCNMKLLASTLQALNESGTLAPCSHCRRLLYLREN